MDRTFGKSTITCKDCGAEVLVPKDIQDNEILTCSGCGTEFIVHKLPKGIEITELQLEGKEDWGE